MPLQNRVTPTGDIIAHEARGLFMGNRGCLHDEARRIVRPYATKLWITCRLAFKERRRKLMRPGRYTELFFLDEAVALAAGHRPCAECRREDYRRWQEYWSIAHGGDRPGAPELDAALQAARIDGKSRRQWTFEASLGDLPDGVVVRSHPDATPQLVLGEQLFSYDPAGWHDPAPRPAPATKVTVLTPRPSVGVLAAGFRPAVHPTAAPTS